MNDHEKAELVNQLRDTAVQFRDTQQLRDRIARLVMPIFKAVSIRTFQKRCVHWAIDCFGLKLVQNKRERDLRFAEEAIELIQARRNVSKEELIRLVEYTYSRPPGEVRQEVGGVVTTLAVLVETELVQVTTEDGQMESVPLDFLEAGEAEYERIQGLIPQIRAKNEVKRQVDASYIQQEVPSGCVGICSTLYDEVCQGCGRTAHEVSHWVTLTNEEKKAIRDRIDRERPPKTPF